VIGRQQGLFDAPLARLARRGENRNVTVGKPVFPGVPALRIDVPGKPLGGSGSSGSRERGERQSPPGRSAWSPRKIPGNTSTTVKAPGGLTHPAESMAPANVTVKRIPAGFGFMNCIRFCGVQRSSPA